MEKGKYIRVNKGIPTVDKSGVRHGILTAVKSIGYVDKDKCKEKKIYWLCKCDCGKEISIPSNKIGRQKSCGCMKAKFSRDTLIKYGEVTAKIPEYSTWSVMKARCYRTTHCKYPQYGGRGIKVCDRWRNSFNNFYEDMGKKPSPDHSIDRLNVDGDYEPRNCRWATRVEQMNNTTRSRYIAYNGERLTVSQLAKKLGVTYPFLYTNYFYNGKSIDDIVKL